jgi:tetratricopeptide (TPR) repeat protein
LAPHESHLRPDAPAEALSGAERDARIEQLLLGGLDLYFASQYEQAINLWTRVLFLDRHHGRARAYIERARSAQAERLRESEAVLHQGIAAFHEGDVARARRLVADALDRGASPDDAQGMLDRIERLGAGQTAPRTKSVVPTRVLDEDGPLDTAAARPHRGPGRMVALLLIAAAVGVLAVGAWGVAIPEPSTWPIFAAATAQREARVVVPMPAEPLPVAGASEAFLSRGRSLAARGQLYDALTELDRIPVGDRVRPDADRLRADIQRHLLGLAAAEGATTPRE